MDLGKIIKDTRRKKGFKQIDLAEKCGITPSYLSQIENNQKEPNLATLKIISEQLDVPLPILFFLSLDDKDIQPEKLKMFQMIRPAVDSMIGEFFQSALLPK